MPPKLVSDRLGEVSKIVATATRDVLAAAVRAEGATHGYPVICVLERVSVTPPAEGEPCAEATAIMVPAPEDAEEAREVLRAVFGMVLDQVDSAHGELTSYVAPGRKGMLQ